MVVMTLSQAFQLGMREEMERDASIFVMGTDLADRGGHFGQVQGLSQEFGSERVRDTPISEAAIVSAGVGAALMGMRPVVDLNFIDFAFGAMDEILNQAAKLPAMYHLPLPLIIRGTSGIAGYAHQHNNSLEGVFAEVPGLLVLYPSTPSDTRALLRSALRGDQPAVMLMHKKLTGFKGEVDPADGPMAPGVAAIRRPGHHATVASYGFMAHEVLRAATELAEQGVEVEVIDLRSMSPLDGETVVASVRKTGRLIFVSDAPAFGGIGAEVSSLVSREAFQYLDAPVERVEAARAPVPHSPPVLEAFIPSVRDIVNAVRRSLGRWPATDDAQRRPS
jgi:pyruvate dehydrogenase E1 component beta subunit